MATEKRRRRTDFLKPLIAALNPRGLLAAPQAVARRLTAGRRALPEFIVIGAQKCGTTTLYNALSLHPQIAPASRKEVHCFNAPQPHSEGWYRSHFPLESELREPRRITGEASPNYMFHPAAAARARAMAPDAKLIAVLRDPVARAYSHYQMSVRKGRETLPFRDALLEESRRIGQLDPQQLPLQVRDPRAHRHFSYRARGLYAQQLRLWEEQYPRAQMLILFGEDFFRDNQEFLDRVCDFIGVDRHDFGPAPVTNRGSYEVLEPDLRDELRAFYAPHNRDLAAWLGNGATLPEKWR